MAVMCIKNKDVFLTSLIIVYKKQKWQEMVFNRDDHNPNNSEINTTKYTHIKLIVGCSKKYVMITITKL